MTPRSSHRARTHRASTRARRALIPAVGLATGIALAAVLPAFAANGAASEIATATFGHASASSWGTADRGGAWSTSVPRGAKATVVSGQARFQSMPRATIAEAVLKSVSTADVDMTTVIGVAPGERTYTALEVRRQTNGNAYKARLEVSPTGSAAINLTRVNSGREASIGAIAVPFRVVSGVPVHLELRVVGSGTVTVSSRAWTGSTTPTTWRISKTDTSTSRIASAGTVGIWQYASSANRAAATTTFDDVHVIADPQTVSTPPATAPPATTPPVAPTEGRGAAAIGSTDYPVPAGALIVSPTGSDSAAGTLTAPLRTLGAAVARAVSGQTIVLRAGSYNESVTIPTSKQLTIQSYPHEAVWLDGSVPVTSWAKTGSTWTTSDWNFFPSSSIAGIPDNPRFVDPAYPLAARPDQVFVNGAQLTQVASATAVKPGTFAVDAVSKTVTIGSDPTGSDVRISNLGQALYVKSIGDVLRGFGVRRYATDSTLYSAVELENTGSTIQNVAIEDNAYVGLNTGNNATTLDHLTVTDNGQLGINSAYSYGLKVTNSVIDDNNSQFFKNAPVSGGIKVGRTRGVVISNNEISGNHSAGFWCDESCYDVTVSGNTVDHNRSSGIQLELSQKAIVVDNEVSGNSTGINIIDTGDVQVYNNDLGDNTSFGIQTQQDSRTAADLSVPGHDPRQPLPDPTVPWLLKNITIANNAFGASSGYQVYAWDGAATGFTITGNLFNLRGTPSQSTLVAWVGHGTSSITRLDTPPAIDAVGRGWTNTQTIAVLPLSGMTQALVQALTVSTPLPAGVAAAAGQPTGTRHVGTF